MLVECISPILKVTDMTVSRKYYVNVLGFKEAEWGNDHFTFMTHGAFGIYLCKGDQGNRGTWVWIGFEGDIDSLYEDFKSKGATIREIPTNYSWALEMKIEDPDGHVLRFGTKPNQNKPYIDPA